MNIYCLKCGTIATWETQETDYPLCAAHGGGEPPEPPDRDELEPPEKVPA